MDLFAPPTKQEIAERYKKREQDIIAEALKLEEAIKKAYPVIQRTVEAAMKAMYR